MPQCGFLGGGRGREVRPRLYVATRDGNVALYSLSPGAPHSEQADEWLAMLAGEVRACRPLRHFTERRLSYADGLREASPPRSRASSPRPQASSPLRRSASPRARSPDRSDRAERWLSQVETATHMPVDVPLWMCPQLSFCLHPQTEGTSDVINARLRRGEALLGSAVSISRPAHPSVRYDSMQDEEQLSRLIGGAMGGQTVARASVSASSRNFPPADAQVSGRTVTLAPAWGAIGNDAVGSSLEQVDGVGMGLEHVQEDWVKA